VEGYELARQLANAIRERFGIPAELGASRALLYAELKELEGKITKDHQVGQTGKTVSPDYYFALGISGAVQHRVGMLRSKRVVAVNVDPAAPIFQIAHYPIVGDLYEAVPRLVELIRQS
jgi:electron transfer flavoprotein alpha subunit